MVGEVQQAGRHLEQVVSGARGEEHGHVADAHQQFPFTKRLLRRLVFVSSSSMFKPSLQDQFRCGRRCIVRASFELLRSIWGTLRSSVSSGSCAIACRPRSAYEHVVVVCRWRRMHCYTTATITSSSGPCAPPQQRPLAVLDAGRRG